MWREGEQTGYISDETYPLRSLEADGLHVGERFTIADAKTGVCIFGGTGSGKTSGAGNALAHGYLAAGFGGIVLCAKPEERTTWEKWVAAAGRRRDLVIFDAHGDHCFNFLEWEAAQPSAGGGLTINIVALLDEIAGAIQNDTQGGDGDNKFFDDALHHLNTNLVDLAALSGLQLSLPLLRDLILSAPQTLDEAGSDVWKERSVCYAALQEAEARIAERGDAQEQADFEETKAYFLSEFPTVSFKTRSIVTLMFSMLTRPFTTRPLRRLFCEETTIQPEDTFDGAVIIVDISVQDYRLAGRIAAIVWKYCWQMAVMRRKRPVEGESPLRPVFLWADEAQNFITDTDAEFQAVARSAGGCTVYLTQNRESFRRVLGNNDTVDAFLGNLQTKVFCQNSSPDTNEWAARLFGARYVGVEGEGMSFHGDSHSISENISEQKRHYVEPADFTTLWRGGDRYDCKVLTIIYKSGEQFFDAASGECVPYKYVVFDQLTDEERFERTYADALRVERAKSATTAGKRG